MAIVTTITTASSRYYMKRSKDEIIRRIEEMRHVLGLPRYTLEERVSLSKQKAWELARLAMEHHAKFPE